MIRNFIFLGPPGVGKGTLAKLVAKEKKMIHISTGDIFREEIANKTTLGIKVKDILAAGEYVPDSLTNEIIKNTLESESVKASGFILDGYPRTENQAKFLEDNNFYITQAVLLVADPLKVQQRLLKRAEIEKRVDDTPEVIQNRIKVYENQTAPLISFYKERNLLIEVDANGNVAENLDRLIKEIF